MQFFVSVTESLREFLFNFRNSHSLHGRWIIQKAFFYPKTVGKCGCEGISWRNLFLYCPTCYQPNGQLGNIRSNQALTLDDLDEFTPTYIGCTTSNQWKRSPSPREAHYEVLTMSSQSIERLDRRQSEGELHGKLMPVDVYLSDVVATSASALNYHMGSMQGDEEPFTDLKVLLGLSTGSSIVSDERHERKRPFCVQVRIFIQLDIYIAFYFFFSARTRVDYQPAKLMRCGY